MTGELACFWGNVPVGPISDKLSKNSWVLETEVLIRQRIPDLTKASTLVGSFKQVFEYSFQKWASYVVLQEYLEYACGPETKCVWGAVADNECGHQKADQGAECVFQSRKGIGCESTA